jgi:HlyD family secretion protein
MKFNKKIIIIFAVALVLIVVIYFLQKPKAALYKTEKVTRGAITQEIAETGTVKKGEEINLNFKSAGTVAQVFVATGQAVVAGQLLAEMDTRQLEIQLSQARANLSLYRAQFEKLKNGAGVEDISIGRTAVQNAQANLESAQAAFDNARENAEQKMASAYKSASDALSSAYAKAFNALNFANLVQRTYFVPQDDDSIHVWETTQKMAIAADKIKSSLDLSQMSISTGSFDNVLSVSLDQLSVIDNGLRDIRSICEKKAWRDIVTAADKNSLDTHRDYIVAAITAINSSRQNITLQKNTNDSAVNAAQAAVTAASGALKTAQEQLGKTVANPRSEDMAVLEAQIEQAVSQVDLLELQIEDGQLKSPLAGQAAQVNIEAGETVLPSGVSAIVVLPDNPYQVEVDVYEEDVANEKVGNRARITPVAQPDAVYEGSVVSIDPVGKLINGVVYYSTKIGFDAPPVGLKPEMTADVVIVTAQSDNALLVSEGAVLKNDQGYYVQVLKNGKSEDVLVQVGIKSKGMAQIVSGVGEDAEVIIP